jgi:hypothetical protein
LEKEGVNSHRNTERLILPNADITVKLWRQKTVELPRTRSFSLIKSGHNGLIVNTNTRTPENVSAPAIKQSLLAR